MKIVINCRVLNKRNGGPRRFLINFLLNLSSVDNANQYYLVVDRKPEIDLNLGDNFQIINLNSGNRIWYEYFLLPNFVNKLKSDIFIVPDPVFSPFIKGKKITVCHDVIYFEKQQVREFNFFDNLHHKLMIPLCIKRTDIVVCVSNFTESRVQEILGAKNTVVIHEGVEDSFSDVDLKFHDKVLQKYGIEKPFIFFIGSMSPRKNVQRIVHAYHLVKDFIPQNMYLIGGYSWRDKKIKRLLGDPKLGKRVAKLGHIAEADLPIIYNAADALVYPSLYEGFGLPILEAQACNCPVITSGIGATAEISGNSAELVNPYNILDISKSIVSVCTNLERSEELRRLGKENLQRFSWYKFAEEFVNLYERK